MNRIETWWWWKSSPGSTFAEITHHHRNTANISIIASTYWNGNKGDQWKKQVATEKGHIVYLPLVWIGRISLLLTSHDWLKVPLPITRFQSWNVLKSALNSLMLIVALSWFRSRSIDTLSKGIPVFIFPNGFAGYKHYLFWNVVVIKSNRRDSLKLYKVGWWTCNSASKRKELLSEQTRMPGSG